MSRPTKVDALLRRVRERLGPMGFVVIRTTGIGVEIEWAREYDDEMSDLRWVEAASICEALQAVLDWEDEADREEAA